MKTTLAIVLVSVLACPPSALGADARQMGARAPGRESTARQAEHRQDTPHDAPIGSRVRILLKNGGTMTGVLMAFNENFVVVKPATRLPEPEVTIPREAIQRLERAPNRAGVLGATLGAAAGIAILAVLFRFIRWMA